MLTLRFLGGAVAEKDGAPYTGKAVQTRRMALLALLASARGRPVPREKLLGQLWQESPANAARHLLAESLYVIRKELGSGIIHSSGSDVRLNLSELRLDVEDFEVALERGDHQAAVALYAGPFLDGFFVSEAPEFGWWQDAERDRYARAWAGALETLAKRHQAQDELATAAECWRRLYESDRANARVLLHLVSVLDAIGERATALRYADAHRTYVREELLAEPSPEVSACIRRLKATPGPLSGVPEHAPPVISEAEVPAGEGSASGGTSDSKNGESTVIGTAAGHVRDAAAGALHGTGARPHPNVRLRKLGGWQVAAGAAAMLVLALLSALRPSDAAHVDSESYLILPFVPERGDARALTPDESELLMHDAFSGWADVRVVDGLRVRDAIIRSGSPATLGDAQALARRLGAGKVVWGSIALVGSRQIVRASVYDSRTGEPLAEKDAAYPVGGDPARTFRSIAGVLLGGSGEEAGGDSEETRSLSALHSYQEGRLALERWDLPRAQAALSRAIAVDPAYTAAYLRLAEAMAWSGKDVAGWKQFAVRAHQGSSRLSSPDSLLAAGLLAQAVEDYPEACRLYEALIRRDSTSFAAWFGLGDCLSHDDHVVRDTRSPSGWRFRTSSERAMAAYSRALQLVPSSHLAFRGVGLARLARLFAVDAHTIRMGSAGGSDSLRFGAYPGLDADTLIYVPYPRANIAALRKETIPSTRSAALARNRRILNEILQGWVAVFPASPDAHEAFAQELERMGAVGNVRQGQPSALSEVRLARRLARDEDQRLRLAIAEARIRLKLRDWVGTRSMVDSLVLHWRVRDSHDAQRLAPLAVLTGRLARARELARQSSPEHVAFTAHGVRADVQEPVTVAALDALVFDALGMHREGEAAERRFETALHTWVAPPQQSNAREALLLPVHRVGFTAATPFHRVTFPAGDHVARAQGRLLAGDRAGARAVLDSVEAARGDRRPGDLSIDFAVAEAEIRLALGDTLRAQAILDGALEGMVVMSPRLLDELSQAGSIARAMLLRATLARTSGDVRLAARWSSAVRVLWANADPVVIRSAATNRTPLR